MTGSLVHCRYLGVDLAWGQCNRTGLAMLDQDGVLIASTSVRTDDEIVLFTDTYGGRTLVAAVDAPLIVPNDTGRRPCEASVGAAFSRYRAGAYPANRGIPSFYPEPRGARLAARLGWDMDPMVEPAASRRLCIEVYPHPAMVSLFGLPYVIPYKKKKGRDVAARRTAFAALLDEMESLCGNLLRLDTSARWAELRGAVRTAGRHSTLDRAEDEIDGIFCAYLAWLWVNDRESLVVHGDGQSGYIVTPPPPVTPPGPSSASVARPGITRSAEKL